MLTPYMFGQMVKRSFELGKPPHSATAFKPQPPGPPSSLPTRSVDESTRMEEAGIKARGRLPAAQLQSIYGNEQPKLQPPAPKQNQLPPMVAPQKAQPYQDPYQHPKYIATVDSLTKRDNAMQDFSKTWNPASLGSAAYHNHMGGINRIGEVIGNGYGDARNAIVNTFGGNNSGTPPAQ